MIYKFTIPGTMPNLNDYLKAERVRFKTNNGKTNTKGNELKKSWQQVVCLCIRKYLKSTKITVPVRLHYKFYEPNMKRDLDNIASFAMKITQDSLVLAGVLENDGWKNIVGFDCEFMVDSSNPRIEVIIEEVCNG